MPRTGSSWLLCPIAVISVGNLSTQFVNLEKNLLTGPIPDAVGYLQKLQVLALDRNQIYGDIPPSLGNLSALSHLYISDNSLTGDIPPTLWHLPSLIVLDLSGNHLTGGISPSIGNLSASLTLVYLDENSFTGNIPPSLGNLHFLTDLTMAFNNLTGTVPQSLWNLSNLVTLDLQSNQLLPAALPLDLGHALPSLKYLSLCKNKFHGPIPMSLSNASSLEIIQLNENLFTGTIPPSLGNLQSLTRLLLFSNQLEATTGTGWDFLSNLSNCTILKFLALGSNNLAGELPQSVANLSSSTLEDLSLNLNSISGSIPPEIGNLVSLSSLSMEHNLLNGTIPSTIGKLTKLHKLLLYNNRLSGEIPFAIGNLTLLNELDLNSNYLIGRIPHTLGDCRQLLEIDLGSNSITGMIPSQVLTISSLGSINLGGNFLSGSFADVGNLINLVELDLSHNRLSGEIPSTTSLCQELQLLYLQGNNFNGTIPSSFSAALQVLDISCNNLSGHIPESLASIKSLVMLNLSFNDLDGEVPKGGAFRNSTEVSLSGNRDLCSNNSELDLPPCVKQRKHQYSRLAIIFSVVGASLCLVAILCIIFARWQKHKSRNKHDPSAIQQPLENEHIRVSYNELLKATDGFSSANLIGQGSFGTVYKGTMSYHGNQNVNVAVKVLNLQQRGASMSFMAECKALRNIRHRNLLKIITSCSSIDHQGNDFKALVFEYLPNGSLEKWLHCKENDERAVQGKLSLIQRLSIAIDTASALDYLHNKGPIPIVHCDLKPGNILLANDMTACVGDFGLARFLIEYATRSSQRSSSSIILKGSVGYIAPEYGIGNEVSTQGDLYSYGIIILEMFTGRGPTDDGFKEGLNLHRFVEMTFPEQLMRIIDPYLLIDRDVDILHQDMGVKNKNLECITQVLQIGLSCSKESPMDRMHIEDVIKNMQDIRDAYNRNGT